MFEYMKKLLYTFSALMMSCIMSFSGIGGTYLQARASSGAFDSLWNTDASAWENIKKHINLWCAAAGAIINPVSFLITADDFYQYMVSDGHTEQEAHDVMCGCDGSHESCSGYVHGGGGFIRDGITRDEKGNVTYSDEVSDLFHGYIKNYLDTNNGYFLWRSIKAAEADASIFPSKEFRENFIKTIDNFGLAYAEVDSGLSYITMGYLPTENVWIWKKSSDLASKLNGEIHVLEADWSWDEMHFFTTAEGSTSSSDRQLKLKERSYDLGDLYVSTYAATPYLISDYGSIGLYTIFSNDGRIIKVWYDYDAFKRFSVGQQPYYYTSNWVNYDASVDNSMTLTENQYQYYYDNSSTIYQTIQNNVTNSNTDGSITEQEVQKIVDDAVDQILKEMENNNSGGSSGGSSDSSGGSGVLDVLEGLGKILDTLLSLIGKVMGVVADFTSSLLELFSGFTSFTDGFSDFLAEAFTFIPVEIWDLIKAGLGLVILLSVIKLLRG